MLNVSWKLRTVLDMVTCSLNLGERHLCLCTDPRHLMLVGLLPLCYTSMVASWLLLMLSREVVMSAGMLIAWTAWCALDPLFCTYVAARLC